MSLLSEAMETCYMLDRRTVSDGYGGYRSEWAQGVEFKAAFVFDTSVEARVADAQGVKNIYTITTSRAITLMNNDIIERKSDGKIFRITSDGTDKKTPKSARLDMRNVTAEQWQLPTDEGEDG